MSFITQHEKYYARLHKEHSSNKRVKRTFHLVTDMEKSALKQ